jgi:uncharacterized protein
MEKTGGITRRQMISALACSTAALSASNPPRALAGIMGSLPQKTLPSTAPRRLRAFDYRGVRLLESPLQQQMRRTRDMYFNMPSDDMLKGYRRMANLPDPGNNMTGWSARSTSSTFGQWLSGYARLGCALDDRALQDKCIYLINEWEKTISPDGNPRIPKPYGWEKLSCALVDAAQYADFPHALEILDRITMWASRNFDRSRVPATREDRAGRGPANTNEWYTLPENSFRAYEMTGNKAFLEFAKLWLYPVFWNKFLNTSVPEGVEWLHAYSHVNSFNSAAMAYSVLQDPQYLTVICNAYDWIRRTQTYASGGYGPGEWTVPANGSLGDALDVRIDHAEIPCGSWAAFKLSRYLMEFTGDARYGDWIETLLYNGIGAALPMEPDGSTYYYANYHTAMASKIFYWSQWPCCSGTYLQDVADYHNLIYYHSDDSLYVNLTVPSEVLWMVNSTRVTLTQRTSYPGNDAALLEIHADQPVAFTLKVRIPSWCTNPAVSTNGERGTFMGLTNQWMTIRRTWHDDKVTVQFPMKPRAVPVDPQHPNRIAMMYGPLLMVQDARYTFPIRGDANTIVPYLTKVSDLPELMLGSVRSFGYDPNAIRADINTANGEEVGHFIPFYAVPQRNPYRAYIDIDRKSFF